jgi:hypothetical protein
MFEVTKTVQYIVADVYFTTLQKNDDVSVVILNTELVEDIIQNPALFFL